MKSDNSAKRVLNFLITYICVDALEIYETEIKRIWDLDQFTCLASEVELTQDGKPHIQCYVKTKNTKTKSAVIKLVNKNKASGFHWDVRPETYQNCKDNALFMWNYCTNERNDKRVVAGPITYGDKPKSSEELNQTCGLNEKRRWESIKASIVEDRRDDIPFDVVLKFGHRFQFVRDFYAPEDDRKSISEWEPYLFKNYTGRTEGVLTNDQLQRMSGLSIVLEPINVKKRHIWLWSRKSNYGKSGFAQYVLKNFKALMKCGKQSIFDYWNEVKDNHEILILDEYNKVKMDYDELNLMCDGSSQLRIFGTNRPSPFKYIFVMCNKPIDELYINMYDQVRARFKEYDLSLYMDQYHE